MIYAGTDLKFRVTAKLVGFYPSTDNFCILIRNRWNQITNLIEKQDMLTDEDDNFYFTMEAVKNGIYYAELIAERDDTDFDAAVQRVVDKQYLCSVGMENEYEEQDTDGMAVSYQRVWTVCIGGYLYLAEEDGTPILDANGERIFLKSTGKEKSAHVTLSMTAAEVKDLLEGRNQNGKIDTIPEMMDTMGGIPEDTEETLMTEEDADAMMRDILGNNER